MQDFTVFIGADELKLYEAAKGTKCGHDWTDKVIEEAKSKDGKLPGKWLGYNWMVYQSLKND